MVAIVAMFAIATVPGSIGEADAKLVQNQHVKLAEAEPNVDLSMTQVGDTQFVKSSEVVIRSVAGDPISATDPDVAIYRVVYTISNDGTTDVQNILISVHSDTETVDGKLLGWLDVKHSTISVLVKAIDPALIDAKIVGYEI